eukprot:Nk52_evm1s96 gene=Nk52_evmTU1s96
MAEGCDHSTELPEEQCVDCSSKNSVSSAKSLSSLSDLSCVETPTHSLPLLGNYSSSIYSNSCLPSTAASNSNSSAASTCSCDNNETNFGTTNNEGKNGIEEMSLAQLERLANVLEDIYYIHGSGNFPTLSIPCKTAVLHIQEKLIEAGINIKNVRFNGSVAGYVLSDAEIKRHNDLDIVFMIDFGEEDCDKKFNVIRNVVLQCLMDWFPEHYKLDFIGEDVISKAYVQKMCKVHSSDADSWSLITLRNSFSRNLELKFVNSMKRQFEFSMDSFQIILNNHENGEGILLPYSKSDELIYTSEPFPCPVFAESKWGDFEEALNHLNNRLIAIRNPEEIRGGGLLKYCSLLAQKYEHSLPSAEEIEKLERYMVNRFVIDFCQDESFLYKTIVGYLENHFANDPMLGLDYLNKLCMIINNSAINEKYKVLSVIDYLRSFTEYQLSTMYNNYCPPTFGCDLDNTRALNFQSPIYYPKFQASNPSNVAYPLMNVGQSDCHFFNHPATTYSYSYSNGYPSL